jgi:hypothetical protein
LATAAEAQAEFLQLQEFLHQEEMDYKAPEAVAAAEVLLRPKQLLHQDKVAQEL